MQQGMPISILSQTLKRKTLLLSIHEKKFYAIVMAIQKWKAYLLGRCFIITIYYQILKYLLDQKIGTHMQQKWLSKILGYDFVVQYKKGPKNRVADAFSRQEEDDVTLTLLSIPNLDWD